MKSLKYIFFFSLLGTVGSLYISHFGDPRQNVRSNDLWNTAKAAIPCTLCWYVRICLFPIVFLSGLGRKKHDHTIWKPIAILSSLGLLLSTYIWGIEMHRWTKSSELCGINAIIPCGDPPILWGGRFTLASAGIIMFSCILRNCLQLKKHNHK